VLPQVSKSIVSVRLHDQRAQVNSLIKRRLCRLFFTQYKNSWLVRIRLCRLVGIRRYH